MIMYSTLYELLFFAYQSENISHESIIITKTNCELKKTEDPNFE